MKIFKNISYIWSLKLKRNTRNITSYWEIFYRNSHLTKNSSDLKLFWKNCQNPWKLHLKEFIFSSSWALHIQFYSRMSICTYLFNCFNIASEQLERPPAGDSGSGVSGKRHSSDVIEPISCDQQYQWSPLGLVHSMVSYLKRTN